MRLPDSFLDSLLNDDVPYGDMTSHGLGLGDRTGRMRFYARDRQVVCCIEEAQRLVERVGAVARIFRRSGDAVEAGTLLLEAEGAAEALLAVWKVAQTLVEATSGIAGAVAATVKAAEEAGGAVVACTRKNFPGTKAASLKAVRAGGGVPHRLGLSESLLVFPEHRAFLGDETPLALARLKAACPEKKLVVEVKGVEEALVMAEAGADVLQLEKFSVEAVAALADKLKFRPDAPLLAAAGGVNAANAGAYVRAGAKILVTSAPYWAKPTEIAVVIEAA